jgi:hypothetical protein
MKSYKRILGVFLVNLVILSVGIVIAELTFGGGLTLIT